VVSDDVNVAALRGAQLDVMADLLAAHVDIGAVLGLVESGAPARPVIAGSLLP
jgi:adenosylcobyric acid synthase